MGVVHALERIVQAGRETGVNGELDALLSSYEQTLQTLERTDDEGVEVVTDWIVEQIRTERSLPSARDVRRRAATFCRDHNHNIPDDSWIST